VAEAREKRERPNGVVRPFVPVEATCTDKQRKACETECGAGVFSWARAKQPRVDPVRDDMTQRALQERLASLLIELAPRCDHPHARAEAVPMAVLKPFAEEPN
jgi:hypothetical protein